MNIIVFHNGNVSNAFTNSPELTVIYEQSARSYIEDTIACETTVPDTDIDAVFLQKQRISENNGAINEIATMFSESEIPCIYIGPPSNIQCVSFTDAGYFTAPRSDAIFYSGTLYNDTDEIINYIRDYKKLVDHNPLDSDETIRTVFEMPDNVHTDNIASLMPPLSRDGNIQLAAKWVQYKLLLTPGPLLDTVHAATVLNLRPEAFRKRHQEGEYDTAQYAGIFSSTMPPLWWRSKLHYIDVAVKDICERERAQCGVCGTQNPDLWATTSSSGTTKSVNEKITPVHYKCSNVVKTRKVNFDSIRCIPEDKQLAPTASTYRSPQEP